MADIRIESTFYKGHKIAIGHPVRVLPTKKGGRDGFNALVRSFRGHEVEVNGKMVGRVTSVEVSDPKGSTRFIAPDHIVPELRNVAKKTAVLVEAKEARKVVPIGRAKKATAPAAKDVTKTVGPALDAATRDAPVAKLTAKERAAIQNQKASAK